MNANKELEYLNSITKINSDTFYKLKTIATYKSFKAKKVLYDINTTSKSIYFLVDGIARCYLKDSKNKEYNNNIYISKTFAAPLPAIINNESINLVYQTLTPCNIWIIDFVKLKKLMQEDKSVANLYISVLEQSHIAYQKRNLELISLNATERYLNLRKQIPSIDNLIPQYQIASFLSITPVQLSRIRRNLKYLD